MTESAKVPAVLDRGEMEMSAADEANDQGPGLSDVLALLAARWRLLLAGPLLAGVLALAGTYLIAPTFTAVTVFMPPQQAQSVASSALASLGALAGLAGAGAAGRTPADQYVALMLSSTVSDRLVDAFGLMQVYDAKFRVDARKQLAQNVRIGVGKKDGLITVEVDDTDPRRAAEIANRYVDELRNMTSTLAVSEAQQRRVFFEQQLKHSQSRLVLAQQALQGSGFNASALKAEPKAAAEAYARLKAEATASEVRLQTLRGNLSDDTPEVRQQQATLAALRQQLARAEQPATDQAGPDYIGKYRDFKYQETLFELYARQFELARVDESRQGALIQVVDAAQPPERKSRPKRAMVALGATAATCLILIFWILMRQGSRAKD